MSLYDLFPYTLNENEFAQSFFLWKDMGFEVRELSNKRGLSASVWKDNTLVARYMCYAETGTYICQYTNIDSGLRVEDTQPAEVFPGTITEEQFTDNYSALWRGLGITTYSEYSTKYGTKMTLSNADNTLRIEYKGHREHGGFVTLWERIKYEDNRKVGEPVPEASFLDVVRGLA